MIVKPTGAQINALDDWVWEHLRFGLALRDIEAIINQWEILRHESENSTNVPEGAASSPPQGD